MLKFDIRNILAKIRHTFDLSKRYVDSISVNLPFGTINLKPTSIESDIAKEIVIFLSDRRVLNSIECCDSCISAALASLQEIRIFLVQKQLILKNHMDSILYCLIEIMLTEMRQFLTYIQPLESHQDVHRTHDSLNEWNNKQQYFSALKTLRRELLIVLSQIANIARIKISDRMLANYSNSIVAEESGYFVLWKEEQNIFTSTLTHDK